MLRALPLKGAPIEGEVARARTAMALVCRRRSRRSRRGATSPAASCHASALMRTKGANPSAPPAAPPPAPPSAPPSPSSTGTSSFSAASMPSRPVSRSKCLRLRAAVSSPSLAAAEDSREAPSCLPRHRATRPSWVGSGSGFGVRGSGFGVRGQGSGSGAGSGLGFGVRGSGFGVRGQGSGSGSGSGLGSG